MSKERFVPYWLGILIFESLPMSAQPKSFTPAAGFVLFTVMLDMLSLGIIIPVLPHLIESFVGSKSTAGFWVGLFGTMWALMQLIFSPIQGGLSDAYGRRPVILGSNLGMGLDYIFMAFAPTLWFLLLGRMISGMTSASISTAYAYMADVTPPEKRAKVFGWLGAAFGLGFIIGPAIGGIVGDIDHRYPFLLAGALSLLNALYGFFVLPESLKKENRKPFSIKASNPIGALKFVTRTKSLGRLALIGMFSNFAHYVLPTVYVLYAAARFGWGPKEVGLALGVVGVFSAFVQAVLTGFMVKWLGEKRVLILGLTCGILGFSGYALSPTGLIMLLFIPLQCLWGMASPSIQALMSAQIGPEEQGTLQGSNMSLSALAGLFAPVTFGSLFMLTSRPDLPPVALGAAFGLSAIILGIGLSLALGVKGREAAKS
jgi:DHA1 family tetracycline resistance protein-like MFS transporter